VDPTAAAVGRFADGQFRYDFIPTISDNSLPPAIANGAESIDHVLLARSASMVPTAQAS